MKQKRFLGRKWVYFYFLFLFVISMRIGIQSDTVTVWLINWFSDQSFVFLSVSAFLFGVAFLSGEWSWARWIRFPNQRAIILFQLKELYQWALISVGILFLYVVVGGVGLYGLFPEQIGNLFSIAFRYILAFLIMANFSVIFQFSPRKIWRYSPTVAVFCIVLLDVLLISPCFYKITGAFVYLIFSWVGYDGFLGPLVMGGIWLLLLLYLLKISSKRDIL